MQPMLGERNEDARPDELALWLAFWIVVSMKHPSVMLRVGA